MAKFRFRLQSVLRHREVVEDERQRELAQILRQRMILQTQLRTMQQTISQSKRDLGDTLTGPVDMDRVASFARYSAQTTQRAQQIVLKLVALEQQVEGARERLLEATRARKALELLQDRHLTLWRRAEDRREDAFLDEVAVQGYVRGRALEVGS